ncbi:glycosyltransferase family 4 protein [Thalassotalea sp. M1531]|uniref:Glycosyltransferase family 4 protein n=1 Tax=Thalassotalea algicola TaxID=2716224 RepID=A0A7Y0LDC6_9GAMM|nr:glycosyltransferase family 4 protein [Thalassotalea algicola]NMP32108.1 glycosyltransferase family 4 protein [Thalassotalea algicola]
MKQFSLQKRILFVHFGEDWLRGSEIVLLDLISAAKQKGHTAILWCNSRVLSEEAEKLDITVITEPFACLGYWFFPRWSFASFISQVKKAIHLIHDFNVDVVHCNNGAPCQWLSFACKWTKVPLILHLHARYQYFDRLMLCFSGADHVVGVSQSVVDVFSEREVRLASMQVIYNGIDKRRAIDNKPIDLRNLVNAHEQDVVLLYIGSLIPRKSVALVIEALGQCSNFKLVVAGDGEEKDNLIALVKSKKLSQQVLFLGEQKNVAALYSSNADCFVSVPNEEVFGLTLAEASLAKLPIITTNIAGVNEIYQDGVNARLIAPNDLDALIGALDELKSRPKRYHIFALTAHTHISTNFNKQSQFEQFDACYNQVIEQRCHDGLSTFLLYHMRCLMQAIIKRGSNKLAQLITRSFKWMSIQS